MYFEYFLKILSQNRMVCGFFKADLKLNGSSVLKVVIQVFHGHINSLLDLFIC